MRRRVLPLDQGERVRQKQVSRESDLERLNHGEVSRNELSRENSFFAPLDPAQFEIHTIGGRRIICGEDPRPTHLPAHHGLRRDES